uniref:phage tail terminator family protein n=1 Tax=Eisenbergiella tayi TaxID=1432052 RepID=UPI003FEFB852
MGTYKEIKTALVKLFKQRYSDFDVYCEEIVNTEETASESENWIFLDIIPAGNTTANEYHTDRSLLIDASIHTKTESNADYLDMAQEIDTLIRPVFRFGMRAITVQNIEFKTVDKVLHGIFTLAFRDTVEEPELPGYMETLDTSVKTQ